MTVTGNKLVNFLDFLSLEWWASDDEGIEDDTDGPDVHLVAVSVSCVKQHFRGNVIGCPADGLFPLSWIFDEGSQAKVSNFDIHLGVQEEITKLQVSVDDLMGVHVVAATDELDHEVASFRFSEAFAATEHVHKRAIMAQLEGQVDVVAVLETIEEGDDIGVF